MEILTSRWPWRALLGVVCALYVYALMDPAIGMDFEEAAWLRRAGVNLAQAQWLRAIPLACTAAWLAVTLHLLRKLGASRGEAWGLVILTAASPVAIHLATHVDRAPLFALIVTTGLLTLLQGRAILTGVLSGLACIVHPGGVALVAVGIVALLRARRFRDAAVLTGVSMLFVAPALGWRLTHLARGTEASAFAMAIGRNFRGVVEGVPRLIGLPGNYYWASVFVPLLIWALWRRWRVVPDLFVVAFCATLLFRIASPDMDLLAALPLVLWMFWRGLRAVPIKEAVAAVVILVAGTELAAAVLRPRMNWPAMTRLFDAARANTQPGDVLLADRDVAFALHTERRAVHSAGLTPDALHAALRRSGAAVVAVTPMDALAYRRSVGALERGGVLEPLPAQGAPAGYRLLRPARQ